MKNYRKYAIAGALIAGCMTSQAFAALTPYNATNGDWATKSANLDRTEAIFVFKKNKGVSRPLIIKAGSRSAGSDATKEEWD